MAMIKSKFLAKKRRKAQGYHWFKGKNPYLKSGIELPLISAQFLFVLSQRGR